MKDGKRLFRASVGGYNKDDVNRYILEQSREFAEREERLREEVHATRLEVEGLREELLRAKEGLEETERLRSELDGAARRAVEQETQIAELTSELEAVRARCTEESDTDREQLNLQVGGIIVNASRAADDMIKKAEETSRKLVSDSERMASDARVRVQGTLDQIINELKEDIQSGTDSCIREFRNYAENITYSSKTLVNEIERKYDEMAGKINYYKDSLEESVAGRVGQLGGDAEHA